MELETPKTPDRASVQLKLIVTGTLFHPFVLGGTDLDAVTIGGVTSMLMLPTAVDAELPPWSMQVPVTDWKPS